MHAIISLKPKYARLVAAGTKTVEIRRRRVHMEVGTTLWIYATLPEARIIGHARVVDVTFADAETIWERFHTNMGVDEAEFKAYVAGRSEISAVSLDRLVPVRRATTLDGLRKRVRGFHPPQFYARVGHDSNLVTTLQGAIR